MKKLLLGFALAAGLVWVVGESWQALTCRFDGYQRFVVIADGKRLAPVASQNYGLRFPSMQSSKIYEAMSFRISHLEQYKNCFDEYDDPIVIAQFSVPSGQAFTPSTIPPSELRASDPKNPNQASFNPVEFQNRMAPMEYIPWNVEWVAKHGRPWTPPMRFQWGLKESLHKFEISWLQGEALDASDLVGWWQGGWLFRSKTAGHYIRVE